MKKILTLIVFVFMTTFVFGQTELGGARINWSDIRFIINENFDTIYSRVDSLDLILISDTVKVGTELIVRDSTIIEVIDAHNGNFTIKYNNLNSEQIVELPESTYLTDIVFIGQTGTTTVSVGISPGDKSIMSDRIISVGENNLNTLSFLATTLTNIYVNISGGSINLILITKTNI